MRRLFRMAFYAAVAAGVGYGAQHVDLKKLSKLSLPSGTPGANWIPLNTASRSSDSDTIRIGTFNIQVFGTNKIKKPEVVTVLAEIIRRFDVVAIQEVRASDQNLLPQFVEIINSGGRHYDFAIGPRLGRTSSKEQYAFIFDSERIEIDRSGIYTVDDPDDLLHREPMVAPFRVRGPSPADAFTFTLVDIHTDPDEVKSEMNALDDVIQAVRNDGRGEDDVILLGDLNTDDEHLGEVGQLSNLKCALSQVATNTRGNRMYDNLLFDRQATAEFDGRSGVLDMLSEFNLTMDQALEVSDHMPIWAEFSIFEGGHQPALATRPSTTSPQ